MIVYIWLPAIVKDALCQGLPAIVEAAVDALKRPSWLEDVIWHLQSRVVYLSILNPN